MTREEVEKLTAAMDNVDAWRIGQIARAAVAYPAGDLIDTGLALRNFLAERGYFVVKGAAEHAVCRPSLFDQPGMKKDRSDV
jgi:hypothetical protein